MEKKKIIFFLGNGFSQGFNFPNMSDLWDINLDSEDDYYKRLLTEAKERYPLNYFISNDIKDIELLLTVWKCYSEAYEEYTNKQESGRGYYEDYVGNLCHWLHKYTHEGTKSTLFNAFMGWLKALESKYQIIFITTNYDLLLEAIFKQCSLNYHHIGHKESSIPLRKPHGSISWFSSDSGITNTISGVKYEPIFEDETKKIFVYNIAYDCLMSSSMKTFYIQFASQVDEYNSRTIPTLIPPIIGKKYGSLFRQIMWDISHDFEKLDYFIIIGYSFPNSDPLVRNAIVEAYEKNQSENRKIICINDDKNVCDKINELFRKEVHIIPDKWNLEILKGLLN